MGNWNINIQGVGCHHNNNPEIDAALAAKAFVADLVAHGHKVEHATFTSGGVTSLMLIPVAPVAAAPEPEALPDAPVADAPAEPGVDVVEGDAPVETKTGE